MDWAVQYREACPVPGAGADAYGLRELRLVGDVGVLAGIHFVGGDVARPFVGVYAHMRDLVLEEMLAANLELCDAFATTRG